MWICLEGPNCAGKSTLALQIAKCFQSIGHESKLISDDRLYDFILSAEPTARDFVFARHRICSIYKLPPRTEQIVITERWHVTPIVFDYWDKIQQDKSFDYCIENSLPRPDLTMILNPPINVLEHRMKVRGRECIMPLRDQHSRFLDIGKALGIPVHTKSSYSALFSFVHSIWLRTRA